MGKLQSRGMLVVTVDRIPVKAVCATMTSSPQFAGATAPDSRLLQFTDRSNRLKIEVEPAPWVPDSAQRIRLAGASGILQLVVGDYTEPGASSKDGLCANAALIEIDLVAGHARAISSIVGLPPITYRTDGNFDSFSCPLLPNRNVPRQFDIDGVADTLRWGHPLDGRTLFKDVFVVPPHSSLTLEPGKPLIVRRLSTNESPASHKSLDQSQLLESQVAAMLSAAARMPSSNAFLSLSGGLDSRTALVALLSQGHSVPCVSMAGSPYSLDARIARQFCMAHGLAHEIVEFGADYIRCLPDLARQSALLTGGVSSLSQTIDLYLYSQIGKTSLIRISGHLGNQVGRGGVESIAATSVHDQIFSEELRLALARRPLSPWFVPRMTEVGFSSVLFEQEVHYWSIANYMLGSSRALQLSPYADVALLEMAKAWFDDDPQFTNLTRATIRRRDMRHRLFGPPIQRSFQRTILTRHDTAGRNVPINWGWQAHGGWSFRGSPAALRFAADALASKLGRQYKSLKRPMTRLSSALGNPSELVGWPTVLRGPLRTFACDVLLSRRIAESGLFEMSNLRHALDEHFSGHVNHHDTLYRAFEIALGLASDQ